MSDQNMNCDRSIIYQLTETQRSKIQQELGNLLQEKMSLQQSLRQESERSELDKSELFLELLEVFDALDFFLNYIEENPAPNPKFYERLPKSIGTIQKKLLKILEKREVQKIKLEDTKPDYSVCQVVDREVREDLEAQTITKVVRQGFKIGSKILRPVEIITAKKPST